MRARSQRRAPPSRGCTSIVARGSTTEQTGAPPHGHQPDTEKRLPIPSRDADPNMREFTAPADTGPQHAQHPAARGSAAMPQRPGTPRTDAEHANAPAAPRPVPEVHPRREVADSLGRCRRCPPHAGSSASLQPSARVRVVDPRPAGLRRSSPTVRTGGRSPPCGVETLAAHRSTGRSPHMRVACPESAGTRPHPVHHVHQEPGRRHRSQPGSASRRSWPASTSRTWTAGWCVSCAAGATSSASSSAAMTERGNGRWTSSRPTCNFPMASTTTSGSRSCRPTA